MFTCSRCIIYQIHIQSVPLQKCFKRNDYQRCSCQKTGYFATYNLSSSFSDFFERICAWYRCLLNTVARDVPDGKRILMMKINAVHNALSKAIRTRFKIEHIYYVTFRLNLRHLQSIGKYYIQNLNI